jgi:hypothetical protein
VGDRGVGVSVLLRWRVVGWFFRGVRGVGRSLNFERREVGGCDWRIAIARLCVPLVDRSVFSLQAATPHECSTQITINSRSTVNSDGGR